MLTQRADATTRSLPIVGEIAAGGPIEAYQDASESVSVPELIGGSPDTYVLRVRGDSMMDAHPRWRLVVIRPQQNARDGDIVVAQVEENAVTLKRFFKEAGRSASSRPTSDTSPVYEDVLQASSSGRSAASTEPTVDERSSHPHGFHRTVESRCG